MILENTSIGVPLRDLAEAWRNDDFFATYQRKLSS
jgi:hypothetical protein